MQFIHEVVIIGAGISAIGASLELSKNNVEHIILEARDRVGGRIISQTFDGIEIQLGASYVHKPHINNRIAEIMRENGWKAQQSECLGLEFFSEGEDQSACKTYQQVAFSFYQEIQNSYKNVVEVSGTDLSIMEAAEPFLARANLEGRQFVNIMRMNLAILGNIAGTEPSQLSAREHTLFESEQDFTPKGGFSNLFKNIFKSVSAEVKLNQKVTKMDYSSQIIKIHTKENVFLARKVISSLPLGVMQSGTVEFVPSIPQSHQRILKKIGNGNANKAFISFEQPFWDISKKWLMFLTRDEYTKYPVATSIIQGERFILCFFISGETNILLENLSDKQIMEDILNYFSKFDIKKPKIRDFKITSWHKDPLSQGGYSFFKVGLTTDQVNYLRTPIQDKIWFIGEHCRPQDISCTHAAFETGEWAAKQIVLQRQN